MDFWNYIRRRYQQHAEERDPENPRETEFRRETEIGDEEPDLAIQKVMLAEVKLDSERFDFFYVHFYPRIFRYLYQRVWNWDTAEDLTEETFYKALKNLNQFRWAGVSFGAWLFRIALNEANAWFKKRKTRCEQPLPETVLGEDLLVCREPDPARCLEIKRDRELIMRHLARLNEDDQNYLSLYYLVGLSSREIATIADVPWGTMASRIHRALEKLQAIAEENNESG